MTTSPGWQPRPGSTRGEPARRAPRGAGGWFPDDGDRRRQAPRGSVSGGGRGWDGDPDERRPRGADERGPRGGRGPGPGEPGSRDGSRDGQPGNPRAPRAPRTGRTGPLQRPDGRDRPGGPGGRPRPGAPRPGDRESADRDSPAGGLSGAADVISGFDGLRAGPALRWIGSLRVRWAVLVLVGAALLGVVITLLAGRDPGFLLGFFMVVGTLVATLAVRRGAAYLLFPLPALLLFIASIAVGSAHDTGLESAGTAGLASGFTQWVAAVFFPMCVSTILALLVGGGRWVLERQLVTGTSAKAGTPANARPAPSAGRGSPASDPWENGFSPNSSTPPSPSTPRAARLDANGNPSARDSRADRDPWDDPRITGPRSQPPATQRSADASRPAAPRFVPRDGNSNSQPPSTSAPRDPAPRLPRGPRSQPRDPWD